MKLGIVIFPSKGFQDKVNSYRKRYDSHYALIPPHITLKDAFEVAEDDVKNVTAKLTEVAAEVEPVEIEVTKVSSFAPTKNIIFFKVVSSEGLTKIYEVLNDGSFYGKNAHPFVPHFTIGQGFSSQEFEDVYGQLKMAGIDHKETVDKISLCYQLDNGTWNVLETFKLGN
ncbi:YjcG family protein [Macrococcus equipercicus]|uniref:Putative phosphoesterase ERX35_001610 n=1 Tax=Macrococcus equipercicus TaxID=69967 RepID=A0A9Q9BNP6_9STAP|nr:YjcG family protein [Macrococcus equipercicus]KAA1042603.1 hypothetical protein ERX35_001610 [Macrococcus equipercicus]UTH14465.1 YjcG family protein [Macrococcus equipercicus]